jgi:hypothetical protein
VASSQSASSSANSAEGVGIEPRRMPGAIVTNELVNQIREDEGA